MNKKLFYPAFAFLAAFILWTVFLCFIDVHPIGPCESSVGFAAVNAWFHNLTGVHMTLYNVTDWLGLIPVCFIMGFGILGLCQWIKRKHILKVDFSILILGCFYIIVMAIYILFEEFVVNYRPVLIAGHLEASYPSSTTILVMCVMPTAALQLKKRIKSRILRRCITSAIVVFIAFMVICRLISGVHWLTDIVGGILLSAGLVAMYGAVVDLQ